MKNCVVSIKEYKNFNLYGIYKDKKLLYKTCEGNIKDKLGNQGDDRK